MPPKLTYRQVKEYREVLLDKQSGCCAICGKPVDPSSSVLDHDHINGHVRGVLHRGCNSLLGKVENNYRRFGVVDLMSFLAGAGTYLINGSRIPMEQRVIYPTFKTEDEKKEKRKTARSKRVVDKAK